MESRFLAKQVWEFIFPIIKENKTLDDVSGVDNFLLLRLWNIVSPIFKNNETLVAELQKDPYDSDLHAEFRIILRKTLEYNPELEKNVANILEELVEQAKMSKTVIINSKNVVSGSNIQVGGDFRLGDDSINTSDFDIFIKGANEKNNKK
jgi:hypothetical protein